jgi:uncharacterized glyoxalase superfamily protein PhnB
MPRNSMIPGLRYRDAVAAIEFLTSAFGFERHAVYPDPADPSIIMHAQLVLNGEMIMLGTARPAAEPDVYRFRTPEEAGGVTICLYVVVADPDGHHEIAKAAGAEIAVSPKDNDGYPGRSYNARDPEGNNWEFGSYDPWAG